MKSSLNRGPSVLSKLHLGKLRDNRGALNFGESLALKAVSLLLALILWITILGFKKEQIQKSVKFEPLVAPGMIITNKAKVPDSIQYTFSGPRVQLQEFVKKLQPVRKDLRDKRDNIIPLAVGEDLLGELPSGVEVVSIQPSSILIRLEPIVERKIPVRPSVQGDPRVGFEISERRVAPRQVLVAGPKSLLQAMDYVETEPISVQDMDQSVEGVYSVEVDASQGLRLSQDRVVRVELVIQKQRKRRR